MKNIQNIASFIFITAVAILSLVSIFGVWKVFSGDVIWKSFETLGLLAGISVIVIVAGRFIEGKNQSVETISPDAAKPIFKTIRQSTLVALIVSVSLLALLGVLAIWDVIQDKTFMYKIVGSVVVLAFGSLLIVMTSLNQEGNEKFENKNIPVGGIIIVLLIAWVLFGVFGTSIFNY